MQVLSGSSDSEPEDAGVDPLVFSRDDFDTGMIEEEGGASAGICMISCCNTVYVCHLWHQLQQFSLERLRVRESSVTGVSYYYSPTLMLFGTMSTVVSAGSLAPGSMYC